MNQGQPTMPTMVAGKRDFHATQGQTKETNMDNLNALINLFLHYSASQTYSSVAYLVLTFSL